MNKCTQKTIQTNEGKIAWSTSCSQILCNSFRLLRRICAAKQMIEINKLQNVKIEYLELRNIKNLKISNKLKNSKIFVSFYINNVRLIDNF